MTVVATKQTKSMDAIYGALNPQTSTNELANIPANIATTLFNSVAKANVRARHSAGNPRLVCSETYHDSNTLYINAVASPDKTCDRNKSMYTLTRRSESAVKSVQQNTIQIRLRPLCLVLIKAAILCYLTYHVSARDPTAVPAKAPLTKPVKNNMAICVKSRPYELYSLYK